MQVMHYERFYQWEAELIYLKAESSERLYYHAHYQEIL